MSKIKKGGEGTDERMKASAGKRGWEKMKGEGWKRRGGFFGEILLDILPKRE